jgi:hypothetical protein
VKKKKRNVQMPSVRKSISVGSKSKKFDGRLSWRASRRGLPSVHEQRASTLHMNSKEGRVRMTPARSARSVSRGSAKMHAHVQKQRCGRAIHT